MTQLARVTASCEAYGHPTECQEPATGNVVEDSPHNVTVTNTSGITELLATVDSAEMSFPSHAHDYSVEQGCHDMQSHSIDPDTVSSSITINGSPVYIVDSAVGTDPSSGGDVDIIDSGGNNSVIET